MADKKYTPFHVRLAELRKAHGFSYRRLQAELKKEGLNITHTALRKWEIAPGGSRIPLPDQVYALARVFNVKSSFLLEEIFDQESKKDDQRIEAYYDVDLLTEAQHAALLQAKKLFIEANRHNFIGGQKEDEE